MASARVGPETGPPRHGQDDDVKGGVTGPHVSAGAEKYVRERASGERPGNKAVKSESEQLFTIQEAIDHTGFGWFQIKLSFMTGITWMSEAMEMMLLSILGPLLYCEWQLAAWEQALLSTLVMLGMTFGCVLWGKVGDMYGRKPVLILATFFSGYLGLLTSVSPTYTWVAINRLLVGVAIGCVPQCITLYSEYLPTKARASCLLIIEIFFSIGAALALVLAKFIVPSMGWRHLLVFTALPSFFLPLTSHWLPESARFMLTSGRYGEAMAMLGKIAKDNGKTALCGKLRPVEAWENHQGNIGDLLSKRRIRTFTLLNISWFLLGIAYFGIALLPPTLFANPDGCHGNDIVQASTKTKCFSSCHVFTDQDYNDLIVTSIADSPGVLISSVMMLFMGRKTSINVCLFFYSLFLWLSVMCLPRRWLTTFIFISRGAITGAYQTSYVYTTEVYPTTIRALGMGLGSGVSRVGSLITPYIAQSMTISRY